MELEIHHELAGQQVAAFELGAQASFFDQPLEHRFGFIGSGQPGVFAVADADTFRFDGNDHGNIKILHGGIVFQVEADHLADLDAMELHRCADAQSAHRLVEQEHPVAADSVNLLLNAGAIGIETENRVVFRFLTRRGAVRHVKGNAAADNGDHRLGIDLESLGIEGDIDAAGIPEAGVFRDPGMIGRFDEYLDVDRLAVRPEAVAHHLAHLDLPVVDRSADVQGAEIVGVEPEVTSRLTKGNHRRHFQSGEGSGRICPSCPDLWRCRRRRARYRGRRRSRP